MNNDQLLNQIEKIINPLTEIVNQLKVEQIQIQQDIKEQNKNIQILKESLSSLIHDTDLLKLKNDQLQWDNQILKLHLKLILKGKQIHPTKDWRI